MIDRWSAAGRRPAAGLGWRPARITALGALLRRLRRRDGVTLAGMAARLGAQDLGLSPEALSAIERGDAAPPPTFETWIEAGFSLDAAERADLSEAMFLAADPFRAARAGAEEIALDEALRDLAAPVDPAAEDGAEPVKALLRARRLFGAGEALGPAAQSEDGAARSGATPPASLAASERRP